MQLVDVKFDGSQGEVSAALDNGLITITLAEGNPSFPGGGKITIPLDPLFEKLKASSPNVFVKWVEGAAEAVVDAIP